MDYALDKNGNYVHHYNAKQLASYVCPHCLQPVIIRTGINACFYHTPIRERTPLQRTCPEYHENDSYRKIENSLDILYINNGGVPLYLCNIGNRLQLRAYFPTVNEDSIIKLKQIGAKIYVNTGARSEINKKIYNVDNLNFYPVNTIDRWINIKCIPTISSVLVTDVQRKWLWGIRGVDIEKDIYHSNKDGGYRVALKANINVGKTYRIMFDKYAPKITGIDFQKVSEIVLKEGFKNKVISIYDMNIAKFTDEARAFIEGKGYKLIENSNELLPLWPPAVFTGNEITFNEDKAFFLHINNSQKESVYHTQSGGLSEVRNTKGNNYSIVSLPVNENKSVVISEGEDEKFMSEIRYNILHNTSLVKKQPIEQLIIIKDLNNIEVNFNEESLKPPKDGKLYIKSNVPFCATVNNKNYIISSSSMCFENVDYFWKLTINSRAFGIKSYMYERKHMQIKVDDSINWELEYLRLYRCTAPTVNANNKHLQLLYLLYKNINERNIQLYRLIDTWIKTNCIPISSVKYLDRMLKSLGGFINE